MQKFWKFLWNSKNNYRESINQGKDLLFDIDWQGAQQLRRNGRRCSFCIYFTSNKTELENRLNSRTRFRYCC